jgi:S-adenosylmethionine:tRNA-ribosyltransferase-isomerase (queuine synthetase)
MLVSDFQYDLPPERIAQEPLADRAGSRLLHLKSAARRVGRVKVGKTGNFANSPTCCAPMTCWS